MLGDEGLELADHRSPSPTGDFSLCAHDLGHHLVLDESGCERFGESELTQVVEDERATVQGRLRVGRRPA